MTRTRYRDSLLRRLLLAARLPSRPPTRSLRQTPLELRSQRGPTRRPSEVYSQRTRQHRLPDVRRSCPGFPGSPATGVLRMKLAGATPAKVYAAEAGLTAASNLSRIRRWAKRWRSGMSAHKRTKITVETDSVLNIRRRQSIRAWSGVWR
jgi:hypothetical protein